MLTFAVLLVSVAFVAASCPTPKVQENFDLEKFAGVWYEIESSAPLVPISVTKRCPSYKIEFRDKGKAGLLHKYIIALTGTSRSDYSDITTPKSSEPAKLLIAPLKGTILGKKTNLWILDTDYESYAVGFVCKSVLFTSHQEVYILSRTKSLDDKKKMEIYNMLNKRNVSQKNLTAADQKHEDCEKEIE